MVSLPSGMQRVAHPPSCLRNSERLCSCRDVNNAYDEHYDFRKCTFYVVLDNVERQLLSNTDNIGSVPPRVFCIYVEAGVFESIVWTWFFCYSTAIATNRIGGTR